MSVAVPNERGDLWRFAVLPIVVLNLGGIAIFGAYYGLASQQPDAATKLSSGQVMAFLYVFIAVVEWSFALALIHKLRAAGIGVGQLVAPAGNAWRFRVGPALVLFLAFNAVFALYVAAARATGSWPAASDLVLWQRLLIVLVVPASAAFCEELIWRGYLIGRLQAGGRGQRAAIALAALSFALIHGIFLPDKLAVTFVLGLIGGAYYVRERHLLPLMATHLVVDLWSFALYLFAV